MGVGGSGLPPEPPNTCAQPSLRVPARVGTGVKLPAPPRMGSAHPHRWRLSVVRWSVRHGSIKILVAALVKGPLSTPVIAPRLPGARVLSAEIMVSRHSRAWSLVALTVVTLLVLLGALVVPEDTGLRELKGVKRPLRLYRMRPEPAK